MATFPFLRTRRPRGFHYKPRYYDARRERLEALEENARRDLGMDSSSADGHLRARMLLRYREAQGGRRLRRSRLLRPLVLAGLLLLSLYVYLNL